MDIKNLSICIVGNDKAAFLKQCIESCLELTRRISYVDLELKDESAEVAKTCGIHVLNCKSPQEASEAVKKYHKSKWILFLRPEEKIVYESASQIQTLDGNRAMGYSLIIKTPLSPEMLEDYRWMKIPGKRNRYSPESLIVPKIEIRLVQRQYCIEVFNLMVSRSSDRAFSLSSQILKGLQIHSLEHSERTSEAIDSNHSKEKEMKFLRGEVSIDAEEDYGMWELGDSFISYTVLNSNDLSRYYRGLAMGFGSEGMYLTMLHNNLGKFGKFREARAFFDAWQENWGAFDTPEPYKVGGIIYAHLFQLEKAAALFRTYLERAPEKHSGEVLSLLAKALLLLGRKDEALTHLRQSLCLRADKFDSLLMQAIEDSNWKPLKLSVCMIAKDEQSHISKALESVADIADEIIVVDTGSQDETKDIARKYNAKVINAAWEDDFSQARNVGLRSVTGDYVLCLDADEYIDPRERIKLALFKMILPTGRDVAFRTTIDMEDEDEEMSVMLRLPKVIKPDNPVRLFPIRKEICFEGSAFESVDKSITNIGIGIVVNEVFKIAHAATDRKWRDVRKEVAIHKIYDANPGPETAMKAALYDLRLGNTNAALKWLDMAYVENPRFWMKIITLYCRLGQTKNVAGIMKKTIGACSESLELCLAKAELHFAEGEYETVHETLDPHMDEIGRGVTREDRAQAAYLYGMALLETGDLEKSIEFLSDARELDSWNMRYKIGGIYALTVAEQWEDAIRALSAVLQEERLFIADTIQDFSDLGIIFQKLGRHFKTNERIEASELCQKIFLNIVENKISVPEKAEKMIRYLDVYEMGKEQA